MPCVAGHPSNLVLLCCDTFGVLPSVSRLTLEQALFYFVSGFTAKVAGTEEGVGAPQATFSPCYTAASSVWHPVSGSSQAQQQPPAACCHGLGAPAAAAQARAARLLTADGPPLLIPASLLPLDR